MALLQNRRILLKNLIEVLKDSTKDACAGKSFSTSSLTLNKHYDPKFKWLRGKKVIAAEIPDFHEKPSIEKIHSQMKELGILPPRYWRERPMTITCTSTILDPYKPAKGEGKTSFLNKAKMLSLIDSTKAKKEDYLTIKRIKLYEPDFDSKIFPQIAHDIYVKAQTALMKKDPEELSEFVTERAIAEMMEGLKLKTLRWKFLESLEPPVLIQARHDKVISETNYFAQITVRFHTKQTLAIYDRFGRLLFGHEEIPKDVLEYVVFEKHIVNEYGNWRMHGKIIPEWMTPIDSSSRTYRVENVEEDEEEIVDDLEEINLRK